MSTSLGLSVGVDYLHGEHDMKFVTGGLIWVLAAVNCQASQYFCEEQHTAVILGVVEVDKFPGGKALMKTTEDLVVWDEMENSAGYDPSADTYNVIKNWPDGQWIATAYSESIRQVTVVTMNPLSGKVGITTNTQGLTSAALWECTEL